MWEFRVPMFTKDHREVRAWALVDEVDLYEMLGFRWTLNVGGYAARTQWRKNKPNLVIPMHRHLLGLSPGDGLRGDHINRDRLDNRRANLRVVGAAENAQNTTAGRGASRFRGVSWQTNPGKWRADARVNNRRVYLGLYTSESEAAEVALRFRMENMPGAVD